METAAESSTEAAAGEARGSGKAGTSAGARTTQTENDRAGIREAGCVEAGDSQKPDESARGKRVCARGAGQADDVAGEFGDTGFEEAEGSRADRRIWRPRWIAFESEDDSAGEHRASRRI